jgi:hypothetical protein
MARGDGLRLAFARGQIALDEVRPTVAIDYDARTLEAVFATSDGIWPLFFATLYRSRAGSLWNGCYHGAIWRDGAVYVLPREAFGRTWIPNEWVSP